MVTDDEVMWRVAEGAWLYLIEDPGPAGHALVTLAVPDLEGALAALGARGLSRPAVETIPAGRKAPVVDPEGNTITFIEVRASERRSRAPFPGAPLPGRWRSPSQCAQVGVT